MPTAVYAGRLAVHNVESFRGPPTEGTPIELLEREVQLRRLNDAFAHAREGRGRIIALGAEAGAGKTALTEQIFASHAPRAREYWGACVNLSTPDDLLPLCDIA